MTRVLSELLGAKEPDFRQSLASLERASGSPSNDIKLSASISRQAMLKIRQLGLDPRDTTGRELYLALMEKAKRDDQQIRDLLSTGGDTSDLSGQVVRLVKSLASQKQCFSLKSTAVKRLLRANPPKKAMARLGYRSLDSALKHEPTKQLYVAAWLSESTKWQKDILAALKKVQPTDFETRSLEIISPANKHWQKLAADFTAQRRHNILRFRELGLVVVLPVEAKVDGLALAMTALTINDVNDIWINSAYLKLHQVRPDFGDIFVQAIRDEAVTQASLAGQPLPWRLVYHFFANNKDAYSPDIFAPHVQLEDLTMQSVSNHLVKLHPSLEFWLDSGHLGFLHNKQAVSFNVIDVALNYCNKINYESRSIEHFRKSLWRELMTGYLHEKQLSEHLHEQLVDELVDRELLA